MKKQLFTVFGIAAIFAGSMAQEQMPKGTYPIPCNTYEAMEEVFKTDPNAKSRFDLVQSQMDLEYRQEVLNQANNRTAAVPVYTIPVVFHILHQGGSENISDATVIGAMAQINSDYAKTGSDLASIHASFAPLYVDAEIRFELAKKDPNGNCTNGIIRHYDANTNWNQASPSYAYSGSGANKWPTNKYLNIYIVKCIESSTSPCPPTGGFIVGYTYLPGTQSTTSGADAIVYRSDFLTGLNARSLSHEMGHWFNLSHTFGSTNNPGVTCGDDGVTDTPVTKGYFSTCPGGNAGPFTGCTATENMENFMDYSSCPRMFTQGQVTRMRAALTSGTGGRNALWTSTNLAFTGITPGYTCTPVADFAANKQKNCAGNTFTFTSTSQTGASGGSISWSFPGGSPSTSTATSQVVTYATPGTYTVTLTATNAVGTNTLTKNSYITVVNGTGGQTVPYLIDFEGTGLPSNMTVYNNNVGSITWVQNTATGGNSTAKCAYINGASTSATLGHIDWLETPIYDFTSTSGITMSWYYAYAKKVAAQVDSFKVQYSLDCGGSWSNVLGVPALNTMATNSGGTVSASFVPTAAQWKQTNIASALLNNIANKPSVKFRFYFKSDPDHNGSNNIYIDQINLSGNIATSITDLEKSLGLLVYPNPTTGSATIDLNLADNETVKISVVDLVGRVLEETTKTSANGGNITYTVNKSGSFAQGVYIINVDVNNQRISKKLIIE